MYGLKPLERSDWPTWVQFGAAYVMKPSHINWNAHSMKAYHDGVRIPIWTKPTYPKHKPKKKRKKLTVTRGAKSTKIVRPRFDRPSIQTVETCVNCCRHPLLMFRNGSDSLIVGEFHKDPIHGGTHDLNAVEWVSTKAFQVPNVPAEEDALCCS